MSQAPSDLLNEKLASVATDIEAIEELISSEPLQTTDQLLALRTLQELRPPGRRSPGRHLPLRVGWVGWCPTSKFRVPHLRDSVIVAKAGHRAKRDPIA